MKSLFLNKEFVLKGAKYFLLSLGLAGSLSVNAQEYFNSYYEPISHAEFKDIKQTLPEYVGYQRQDRISTGTRLNSVELEYAKMTDEYSEAMAGDGYNPNSDNAIEKMVKYEVLVKNYEMAEALNKEASVWDQKRREEIEAAQGFREGVGMACNEPEEDEEGNMVIEPSAYQEYMCEYANVNDVEIMELKEITDRENERQAFAEQSENANSKESKKRNDNLVSQFLNEQGFMGERRKPYAEKAWKQELSSNLALHSSFCLKDLPSALSDPSGNCRVAVCSTIGPFACAQLGF
jgi:hypothetical protein